MQPMTAAAPPDERLLLGPTQPLGRRLGSAAPLDSFTVLVLVTAAVAVVPSLLKTMLSQKYKTLLDDDVVTNPIANLAQRGLGVLLLLVCVAILLARVRRLPTRGRFALLLLLAPWAWLVVRDIFVGNRPRIATLLYALLILAIWALQPRLERLAPLSGVVLVVAVLSLFLGAVLPGKGIYTNQLGELIAPDKQILPWGILVGVFPNGNVLALLLVCGLPAILLLRSRWLAAAVAVVTCVALLWTSARTELIAVALFLLLALVLTVSAQAVRPAAAVLVLLPSCLATLVLPLIALPDEAFTNRGYIWRISREYLADHAWAGLGTQWYSDISQFVNQLPDTAFSGHNLLMQNLVFGGGFGAVLLLPVLALLISRAVRWAARGVAYPAAFLASLLVCSTLEVPFGFTDRPIMLCTAVLPLAVLALSPGPEPTRGSAADDPQGIQEPTDWLDPVWTWQLEARRAQAAHDAARAHGGRPELPSAAH